MFKRFMFRFGNSLKTAVSYCESKLRSFLGEISRLLGASLFPATLEGADSKSPRIFYILNLVLFVSVILLSPDKIAQVLAPVKLSCTIFDGFQDVAELLRKLLPF